MLSNLAARFEKASATYAETNGLHRDDDWFMLKLHEEVGELTQAYNRATGRGRAKGRTDEEIRQDWRMKRQMCLDTFFCWPTVTGLIFRQPSSANGDLARNSQREAVRTGWRAGCCSKNAQQWRRLFATSAQSALISVVGSNRSGTITAIMPALAALRMPLKESSSARQSAGSTPIRAAAAR